MLKHIILDALLFISVIICPWWVTVILAVGILYHLRFFNELVLFGLMMDILYGNFTSNLHPLDYKFTIFFIVLLLSSFLIKKRLKFYSK